ncbi:MAG: protein translocase subunit SecF [Firmicutes bacterium]|nr:protein translocase subunit SecF [Bacillota bacterium]
MKLMRYRRILFLVSVLAMVFSITAIALKGLNYGIDFTGGTNIRFPLTEWVTSTQVMEALDTEEIRQLELDFGPPQPYNYVDSQTGRQCYGVLITSRFMSEQEQQTVISALEAAFGVSSDESALQINQVEPIIGKELLLNAFYAVLISWALILVYIAFRFEFKSGVAGLLALIHDVLCVMGVFALLGKQIDMNFVAAILTIIGYSINNTIVIFDRIRENLRFKKRDESFVRVADLSIVQSVRRSLNTTATTVLPVFTLYLLGSPTIKDFMFALLVGFLVGNYSSLFMTTPFWSFWKTAEERKSKAGRLATVKGK